MLVVSTALGCIGLAVWPTYVTPTVPLFGIAMCLVFVVPVGVVTAMTGVPISLNVLAEFFGGIIADGDALTLNFFKCYGFVTCLKTIVFTNDLKVAHYVKVSEDTRVLPLAVICFMSIPANVSPGLIVLCPLDSAQSHIQCPNRRHVDRYLCQYGSHVLPDGHGGHMHAQRAQPHDLPEHPHLLHRVRPLGHRRPQKDLRPWRPVHLAASGLPRRCCRCTRLLGAQVEISQRRSSAQGPSRGGLLWRCLLGHLQYVLAFSISNLHTQTNTHIHICIFLHIYTFQLTPLLPRLFVPMACRARGVVVVALYPRPFPQLLVQGKPPSLHPTSSRRPKKK